MQHHNGKTEKVPLSKSAEFILEECRMVLPGIQAIFGFQLIVVFQTTFDQKLTPFEQGLHAVATALNAIAMLLVMTPAAYHRQTRMETISEHFVILSTRLLICAMVPFALSILIDFYLIAELIFTKEIGLLVAGVLGMILTWLWVVLPRGWLQVPLGRKSKKHRESAKVKS